MKRGKYFYFTSIPIELLVVRKHSVNFLKKVHQCSLMTDPTTRMVIITILRCWIEFHQLRRTRHLCSSHRQWKNVRVFHHFHLKSEQNDGGLFIVFNIVPKPRTRFFIQYVGYSRLCVHIATTKLLDNQRFVSRKKFCCREPAWGVVVSGGWFFYAARRRQMKRYSYSPGTQTQLTYRSIGEHVNMWACEHVVFGGIPVRVSWKLKCGMRSWQAEMRFNSTCKIKVERFSLKLI